MRYFFSFSFYVFIFNQKNKIPTINILMYKIVNELTPDYLAMLIISVELFKKHCYNHFLENYVQLGFSHCFEDPLVTSALFFLTLWSGCCLFDKFPIHHIHSLYSIYTWTETTHGRHSANREIGRLIYIENSAIWAIGLLIGLVIRLLRVKRLI